MKDIEETRRRFMAHFAGIGLGSTLLPGVLWGQLQQSGSQRVTAEMLKTSLAVSGIDFSEEDRKAMLQGVNQSMTRYEELRKLHIPNNTSLPLYFTTIVPGMEVSRAALPFRISNPPAVKRPANLEARRVLACPKSCGTDSFQTGDFCGTDPDVSNASAPDQRETELVSSLSWTIWVWRRAETGRL